MDEPAEREENPDPPAGRAVAGASADAFAFAPLLVNEVVRCNLDAPMIFLGSPLGIWNCSGCNGGTLLADVGDENNTGGICAPSYA